jgi:glycosyltransferase involved in cell wall biosynthesis
MKNDLALVIPYFKIDFFKETMDSLCNQTNTNFTIYIGNDASPNNPEEILSAYHDKLNITYQNFTENLGSKSLVQQWNRCLNLVRDENWVLILGDDDVLSNDVVEKFYTEVDTNSSATIFRFSTQVIDEKSTKISPIFTHPKEELGFDFFERKLNGETRSSLSEYVFNKNELLKFGIKDLPLAWFSDLLLVIELGMKKPIVTINDSVVFFRNSGVNITSKNDNLVKKNEATFAFYFYLIQKYKCEISAPFLKVLYSKLEKTILDNKKNVKFWIKTLNLYATNGRFLQFVSLIFKAIRRVL